METQNKYIFSDPGTDSKAVALWDEAVFKYGDMIYTVVFYPYETKLMCGYNDLGRIGQWRSCNTRVLAQHPAFIQIHIHDILDMVLVWRNQYSDMELFEYLGAMFNGS